MSVAAVAERVRSRGWHWPFAASRPHYFVDGESLCEEYLLGDPETDQVWGGDPPLLDSDVIFDTDCPVCAKRVWKAREIRRRIRDRIGGGGDEAA